MYDLLIVVACAISAIGVGKLLLVYTKLQRGPVAYRSNDEFLEW